MQGLLILRHHRFTKFARIGKSREGVRFRFGCQQNAQCYDRQPQQARKARQHGCGPCGGHGGAGAVRHAGHCRVTIDQYMLDRAEEVERDEGNQAPTGEPMDRPEDQRACFVGQDEGKRLAKRPENGCETRCACVKKPAAYRQHQHRPPQKPVDQAGEPGFPDAVGVERPWARMDERPDQAQDHECEDAGSEGLVDGKSLKHGCDLGFGGRRKAGHIEAQPRSHQDRQRRQPMQDARNASIAVARVWRCAHGVPNFAERRHFTATPVAFQCQHEPPALHRGRGRVIAVKTQ